MKITTSKLLAIVIAILFISQANAFPVCLTDIYGATWHFQVIKTNEVYNATGNVDLGGGRVWNASAFWNSKTKETELHAINPNADGCASGYTDSFVDYGTGHGHLDDNGVLIMEGSGNQKNYCNGQDVGGGDWSMTNCNLNKTRLSDKNPKKLPAVSNGKFLDNSSFKLKIGPNPVINFTAIEYTLTEKASLKIVIYNYESQPVKLLANETKAKGTYRLLWDGRDANGNLVIAGVYNIVAIVNGKSFSTLIQVTH